MDRKRGLGPSASRRWGRRLDEERKHNYGNVRGNEEVGGCNPEYKFAESYFDEEDGVLQWPPEQMQIHTSNLINYLKGKDGGPYGSYKNLQGQWSVMENTVTVIFDRIQSDPFAPPSNIRIRLPSAVHRFPSDVISPRLRNVAACDAIARRVCVELKRLDEAENGRFRRTGFEMTKPRQYVLPRKSVVLTDEHLEIRMYVHMPGNGRRVNGYQAAHMFADVLPALVRDALHFGAYDSKRFYDHIKSVEDQEYLRAQLSELGLVAFVADGSILPRESGISDKPMTADAVLPFKSPDSLQVAVTLPNRGRVVGMGLKRGVTLVVGGGYHGKTTLLEALQVGCYNKVPGDGREFVVTSPNAVKVRAEDGRSVSGVDISTFIGTLPNGKDCRVFSTPDASGSTSQAAAIMESVEMGADLLLLDEDISAANFMYRDNLMDALVCKGSEPITTFLLLVQAFYKKLGVSTIMVSGSCGLFMDQADTVIQMNQYTCQDQTQAARDVASRYKVDLREPIAAAVSGNDIFETSQLNGRVVSPHTFKREQQKVRQHGMGSIQYGTENIDLGLLEQLVEPGQTSTITNIIIHLENMFRENRSAVHNKTLRELLELLYSKWSTSKAVGYNGLDDVNGFRPFPAGDCSMPRIFEVAAALNRMRSLSISGFKKAGYQPQSYSALS
ncbi:Predicted ATPase of the ABC class, putative [Babesia bigemina]|uniref:Predicted ATPase of the ABC class, putative n=1 Tax=Babesia bigemina TaxID=5866 RepID=A0A061D887_BABBI|nr:Predicted ATPase of the ABC class, putative [Babesia bigemina]CDR96743.1 Predicted ATPase of the ABC class, putative [Babesia bigemina]|eukprot:XP_012768929.1 Predicted ATPase of the ABC class, putative [Babesia bigemina]